MKNLTFYRNKKKIHTILDLLIYLKRIKTHEHYLYELINFILIDESNSKFLSDVIV